MVIVSYRPNRPEAAMTTPTHLTAVIADQHIADLHRAAAAAGPRMPFAPRLRSLAAALAPRRLATRRWSGSETSRRGRFAA
jgi:hypothetical protein